MLYVLVILALGISAVSFIALLGTMREVMILRQRITTNGEGDYLPSYLGAKIPDGIAMTLAAFDPRLAETTFILLFVSGKCGSCVELLGSLKRYGQANQVENLRASVVAVVLDSSQTLKSELQSLGIRYISDSEHYGSVAELAEVSATPSAVLVVGPGMVAARYRNGVGSGWLIDQTTKICRMEEQRLPQGAYLARRAGLGAASSDLRGAP